jgi:amino acid transporter/nucleotide-binding universal stress UspA family protein
MPAEPSRQTVATLSRELNLFHLTMMGVGMMIGAGAVIGMGTSVRLSGPGGTLLAFALDGLVALFTAMSYAEMSSAIPKAGSIYNFARIAFGRGLGFSAGWISWFASSVAGTFYAVICAEYMIDYLAQLGLLDWLRLSNFWQVRLLAAAISLLFVWINYRGVASTGSTASLLTLGQTITLGFIGLFGVGVFILHPERLANFQPFLPRGWSGVLVCMGFEFIAFEGYEVVAEAGDEALEPRRNLPKAILYSILIVTVTYLLVAFSLIAGVKNVGLPAWEWLASFGEKGFGRAMEKLLPFGSLLAVLTVIFAATSALNSTVYSATRVSYALGRDRMLPAFFGRISHRRSTPHLALLATSLIIIVCLFLPITDIASGASIMFLFLFLLANLAVIRLRWSMEDELPYGFRMPLFPLFPVAAIILQAVLAVFIINVSWIAWVVAPSWIAAGIAVFLLYSRGRVLPIREEILAVEDTPFVSEAAPAGSQAIVMPVQDLESTMAAIPLARRLAQVTKRSIELIHLVSVPDQVPLSDAGKLSLPGQEVMAEAMLYLSFQSRIGTSIMYCRNPSRGILWEARRKKADAILLGWGSSAARRGYVFGSTLDPVLQRAPCDVIIARRPVQSPLRRILVPISSGPNTRLALLLAGLLVDPSEGIVQALHVHRPGGRVIDADALLAGVTLKAGLSMERFKLEIQVSEHPKRVILEYSQNADLVIIGASLPGFGRRILRISLSEEIARECGKPLIVVRAGRTRHLL